MARCNICKSELKSITVGNLSTHLEQKGRKCIKHRDAMCDYRNYVSKRKQKLMTPSLGKPLSETVDPTQTKITQFSAVKKATEYLPGNPTQQKYINNLTILVGSLSLAHRFVESDEFRQLVDDLDPRIKHTSRGTIANKITAKSEEIKASIRILIDECDKIIVVIDIWSRAGLSESYLGFQVQFYSPTLNRVVQPFLALKEIAHPHTGENIMNCVLEILDEWGIQEDKVWFYVTDGGSNVVKALKNCTESVHLFQGNLDPNQGLDMSFDEYSYTEAMEIDDEIGEFERIEKEQNAIFRQKRLPCYSHKSVALLRRIVDKDPGIQKIVKKALNLVRNFTQSGKNKEALIKETNGKGLLKFSQTRWVFVYHMLKRMLELRLALEKCIFNLCLDISLSPQDWIQFENLKKFLEPFAIHVDKLQGSHYATIGKVVPAVESLIYHCEHFSQTFCTGLPMKVKQGLETDFAYCLNPKSKDFNPIFIASTFLEPEFVLALPHSKQQIALCEIKRIVDKQEVLKNSKEKNAQPKRVPSGASAYFGFKRKSEDLRQMETVSQMATVMHNPCDMLIENYLIEIQSLETDEEECTSIDPIDFWKKKQGSSFEVLAKQALSIFAVPATSAGLERVFSIASIVQGGRRYRISGTTTECELMIKINRSLLINKIE